jgi:cyclopropane-fatty-acyl-phospholipid synthase
MASKDAIQSHYDIIGPLHAIRLRDEHGGCPDYTNAWWDGNYNQTLDQAQKEKHRRIFEGLVGTQDLKGMRFLDIGCGWGPILEAVRQRGGEATGLTLSNDQVRHCGKIGLDARLRDYKTLADDELGKFDGIISIGAIEHFCSIQEYLSGKQESVYEQFFAICAKHLKPGGKVFLQTMMWGDVVYDSHTFSLDAPIDSDEAILARMEHMYPDSWPPNSLAQLQGCAKSLFSLESHSNGRKDYIETLRRWDAATPNIWKWKNLPETAVHLARFGWSWLTNQSTRILWQCVQLSDQRQCFHRKILTHERMFYALK